MDSIKKLEELSGVKVWASLSLSRSSPCCFIYAKYHRPIVSIYYVHVLLSKYNFPPSTLILLSIRPFNLFFSFSFDNCGNKTNIMLIFFVYMYVLYMHICPCVCVYGVFFLCTSVCLFIFISTRVEQSRGAFSSLHNSSLPFENSYLSTSVGKF